MLTFSVIVTALLIFGISLAYYKYLGDMWAKAYDYKVEELEAAPIHMVAAAVISILAAIGLCFFISYGGMNSIAQGARVGLFAWLFFVVPTQFSGVIWGRKPLQGFLIDTGCNAVSYILAGAVAGLLL